MPVVPDAVSAVGKGRLPAGEEEGSFCRLCATVHLLCGLQTVALWYLVAFKANWISQLVILLQPRQKLFLAEGQKIGPLSRKVSFQKAVLFHRSSPVFRE